MKIIRVASLIAILGLFIPALPAFAEVRILSFEVEPVVSNRYLVQYSWKMRVSSGEERLGNCTLRISFLDVNGFQIYSKARYLSLSQSSGEITGRGICKPETWQRTKEYKAHIKCE
jgi:hypothetical protein